MPLSPHVNTFAGSPLDRAADRREDTAWLESQLERDDGSALTNVFTGRPARSLYNRLMREQGPLSNVAPAFPTAGGALVPLRGITEKQGRADFSSLWSGQAAALVRHPMTSAELTRYLGDPGST